MGKISDTKHNIYVDLPWCLIAEQRFYALVLDAIAYAKYTACMYFSQRKLLTCQIMPFPFLITTVDL
jgi:hypothetical protein